ncbi:MAG: hypothetical protein Q7R96_03235 [Nanoarchaeota archaeon]|nr:hypothetical protein [Nanoarchaeota archaeon]
MNIQAKVILEIIGSPEEHVNEVMQTLLEKIQTKKETQLGEHKIFKAKKMDNGKLYSSFTEATINFNDPSTLLGFCFDFMPSSIEILTPERLELKEKDMSDFVNDLLAKLHQYDMILKNVHAENVMLKRKMGITS